MAPASMLFAVILIFTANRVLGELICSKLGDSVHLSANEKCSDGERFQVIHRLKDDSIRTVATLVDGVWMPQEDYKGRVKQHSASSIVLTCVNYNDNGLYELTCGSRDTLIELEVMPFDDVSAPEGDTVTLPCHSFTAGEPAKRVRWERNRELVAELDTSSGEVRYGTEFERRVSVSPDYMKGNTSLTFDRVKFDDQGDFLCHAQDKDGKRKPVAVRMRVNKKNPGQTTSKPPPPTPRPLEMGTWTVVAITAAVVCLIVAPLAAVFGSWLKSYRSKSAADVKVETFK
ncbi:uncharacterized protein LOC119912496 [Micropterus salmoides]|uniref:uncharacterized protein LOC119912496 n=1 Tax=Micropterus salmoides TaxID=27706 RepID=UPI0018EB6341|nr:uncharacterized protein LOC119912496 [Micropterus salmoides]